MHPYPALAGYPTKGNPSVAQTGVINGEITNAIADIDALLSPATFLTPNTGGAAFLDAVFGPAQRAEVVKNYGLMQQVLTSWQNTPGLVKVSSWLPLFTRQAQTNASSKVLTLPDFAAAAPPATLRETLIHESAHGVKPQIIDTAYTNAAVGFRTIPGAARPLNAPYYDYAVVAWQGGNLPATVLQAGDPNTAVGAAVGPGAQRQPPLGTQFQRAQAIVTHARIHAENMLEGLTDNCRLGAVNKAMMKLADGLPMPFLATYWNSWVNTDHLAQADIDAVNNFVIALTAFHTSVSNTTYSVIVDVAESCTFNLAIPTQMDIRARAMADTTQHPVQGDLTADPWIGLIMAAFFTAYPPPLPSGLTPAALAKVDLQYHVARSEGSHP